MISKELLSEVFETKAFINDIIDDKIIQVHYFIDGVPIYNNINIYELAHKCKQWAIKNSYGISVHTSEISGCIVEINCGFDVTDFHNISEPEAIFKACQYIMENKCGS